MSDSRRTLAGFVAIAVVALVVVLLPSGGNALSVVGDAIRAAFLAAIAYSGWRLYHDQQFWLNSLTDLQRGLLYGAIATAVFVITAAERFTRFAGGGVVMWGLVIACGVVVYRVWADSRRLV